MSLENDDTETMVTDFTLASIKKKKKRKNTHIEEISNLEKEDDVVLAHGNDSENTECPKKSKSKNEQKRKKKRKVKNNEDNTDISDIENEDITAMNKNEEVEADQQVLLDKDELESTEKPKGEDAYLLKQKKKLEEKAEKEKRRIEEKREKELQRAMEKYKIRKEKQADKKKDKQKDNEKKKEAENEKCRKLEMQLKKIKFTTIPENLKFKKLPENHELLLECFNKLSEYEESAKKKESI